MARLPQRAGFWAGIALLAAGLTGLLAFLYTTRVTTRRFRLEKLRLEVPGRTGSAEHGRTLRILHLSDLHLQKGDDKKVEFIRAITGDDYDMVVLTGDIFQFSESFHYGPFLLARQPRLGAYAVLGNHDYYDYSIINKTIGRIIRSMRSPEERKDVSPHIKALEDGGFTVFRNQCLTLEKEGIFIAGVDYPGIHPDELMQLMRQAPPEKGMLKLGLFHLPWRLEQYAAAGFDLVFGGHTHGGQIRLPAVGALITDSELHRSEASGLLRRGKTHFHISRGLGADPRSNIRFFCPPAATVIELVQLPAPAAAESQSGAGNLSTAGLSKNQITA